MKQIIGNGSSESYTFNAATNTIVITGPALTVESLLLINNPTRETIIYNPFSSGKGYTSFTSTTTAGGVVTTIVLEYNTSAFNDADKLQIFYDNSNIVEQQVSDLAIQIKKLFYRLDMMPINNTVQPTNAATTNADAHVRVVLSALSNVGTLTTLTSVGGSSVDARSTITDPLLEDRFLQKIRPRITT